MTIRAGRHHLTAKARLVTDATSVQAVVQKFQGKYTPKEIARYTGFAAAVQMRIGS